MLAATLATSIRSWPRSRIYAWAHRRHNLGSNPAAFEFGQPPWLISLAGLQPVASLIDVASRSSPSGAPPPSGRALADLHSASYLLFFPVSLSKPALTYLSNCPLSFATSVTHTMISREHPCRDSFSHHSKVSWPITTLEPSHQRPRA